MRGQLLPALITDGADDDVIRVVVRGQFDSARTHEGGEQTQLVDLAGSFESDLVSGSDDIDLVVGPEERGACGGRRGQQEFDLEIARLFGALIGDEVDEDERVERLLIGFVPDHELAGLRRRGPMHMPQIIAGDVFTCVEVAGGVTGADLAVIEAGRPDRRILRNSRRQNRHGHGDGERPVDLLLHLHQAEGTEDRDEDRFDPGDTTSVGGEGSQHRLRSPMGQSRNIAGGGIAEALGRNEVDGRGRNRELADIGHARLQFDLFALGGQGVTVSRGGQRHLVEVRAHRDRHPTGAPEDEQRREQNQAEQQQTGRQQAGQREAVGRDDQGRPGKDEDDARSAQSHAVTGSSRRARGTALGR